MRMIKIAALAVAVGLLAACAAPPQKSPEVQLLEASAESDGVGVYSAGTLAPLGSFEWKVAPSYTHLALVRHNAARSLRKHELTFEQAMSVMNITNRARKALDDAVAADARKDAKAAEKLAKDGADAIADAEEILRGDLQ